MIIPGLLQTEDYAHSTHLTAHHLVESSAVENRVAARMQRQQRLTGTDPLRLHTVITEAALRLEVGGPAVMVNQLERLLDTASAEHITIQVHLISDAGDLAAMVHMFDDLRESALDTAESMEVLTAILGAHRRKGDADAPSGPSS